MNEFAQTENINIMKKQCKNCGSSVEHFNIDYDAGLIRCFYCKHTLPTEMFFNDITVNKFAKKIPEGRRDEFLAKLGFETKQIRKSAIIIGLLIALAATVTSLNKILEKKDNIADLIFALLPSLIVLIPVIKTFWDGNSPKYVKKNKGIKNDSK